MIRRLEQKPEGKFEKLPNHYMWFDFCNEDGTYAYVGVEIISIWASFHTEVIRWNHNIAKIFKKDWGNLKILAKSRGAKIAIASNENVDDIKRWTKFIKLFGFPKPKTILMSEQEL
jgi:hypothetical protein